MQGQVGEWHRVCDLAGGDAVEEPLAQRLVHFAADVVVCLRDAGLLGRITEVEVVEVGDDGGRPTGHLTIEQLRRPTAPVK